jgi:sugar lactone lactonase YvrE
MNSATARRREIIRIAATNNVCGEGAVWHPEEASVYWTDINRRLLHRYRINDASTETWQFDQPVTAAVLTQDPEQLLVVLGGKMILWNTQSPHRTRTFFELPSWPTVRCNDARVGPDDALWFGTMQNNVGDDGSTMPTTEHVGELLCLNASGRTKSWHTSIGIANTVAWSPAGDRLYFGDTVRNVIYGCNFDASTGPVVPPGTFTRDFSRGLPDGSAMDSEGYLWNCRYGGSCIVRFAPDGSVAEVIEMPVKNPTTCAFGGDDLKTLYITSAKDESDAGDLGGSLFSMQVEVAGLPSNRFRF